MLTLLVLTTKRFHVHMRSCVCNSSGWIVGICHVYVLLGRRCVHTVTQELDMHDVLIIGSTPGDWLSVRLTLVHFCSKLVATVGIKRGITRRPRSTVVSKLNNKLAKTSVGIMNNDTQSPEDESRTNSRNVMHVKYIKRRWCWRIY
jgi:hypothetical protein